MSVKKVQVAGTVWLMNDNEVIKHVPNDILTDIRKKDAHPMFAMMSIGSQGESQGALFEGTPGMGKKMSSWYKQLWPLKAIKRLVALMKPNHFVPVFETHPSGDPTENRVVVGSIINGVKKVINNITHAVGIAYINNFGTRKKIERGDFDACSLEASCLFSESENMFKYVVEKVNNLSGVALCNAEITPPGFDDSNILAVVTAMSPPSDDDDDDGDDDNDDDEGKRTRKRSKPMNLEEVKAYIREHQVKPAVLFSTEDMTKDAKVIDAFKADYDKEIDTLKEANKTLTEELEPLKNLTQKSKVAALIEKSDLLKDEYKEVVQFLKKTLTVEPVEGEDLQVTVDKGIQSSLESMKETGMKTKFAEQGSDDDNKGEEEDPKTKGKQQASKSDKGDLTKPENNELIPQEEK